ncbi:MAG TPA: PP2C family protein-serine/threonine phosphatase [Terracidiphilus sp.]|nr:PP2C family protein-serine/threonine phosphatase [Terracidiphilus sp.]
MRRRLTILAALVVWASLQSAGQPPPGHPGGPDHGGGHPGGPLGAILAPHQHARPPQANRTSTPDVIVDATAMGSPLELDRNWRVGITGNPAAANADFDDTTWDVRKASEAIADVPDMDAPPEDGQHGQPPPDHRGPPQGHQRPFAWFRLHIKLAPNHGPVALLIQLPVSHSTSISIGEGITPDVYANGKMIQPDGPHGDHPERYQMISRIYQLNVPPEETSLVLVIRTMYIPFGYNTYTQFFANRTVYLGAPGDLGQLLELWANHSLFERIPRLTVAILLVVMAIFLLVLYYVQRGHAEYLWLAMHELAQAPLPFLELEGSSARLDQIWYAASVIQLVLLSAYLYFEFLVSFLALKRRWYVVWLRYTAPILAGIAPGLLLVGHSTFMAICLAVVGIGTALWMLGWVLFCFITLIKATVRRNFEAGLLLLPLVLSFVGMLEGIFASNMSDFTGRDYHSPLTMQAGPIPIHFASIADFSGLLVIVVIIFLRFLRIQSDQERASSELAAARNVQELLIPQEKLNTPGFQVDSVYNPANEVGGDFYHVETTGDGGLLVVLGDVAGKGLKAAMNVSMLMGALRRMPDRSPAKILESLNRVLAGSESFTTCQAAWFGGDGELVLANAGHLPPYLNTQEIFLPGGLPLGAIPEVKYEEVRLYLHPGDRMLMMSDGVVEARQPSGELFGFDRVHNLSNQTAFYIADAAKSFGQEDDITVLTVRREAQAMVA